MLVSRILSERGYKVSDAGSGEEALSLVGTPSQRFDMLLTDLKMPGMGGKELAKRARTIRPDLPIVFMSGYADGSDRLMTASDEFIEKPFTAVSLVAKIQQAFERHSNAMAAGIDRGRTALLSAVTQR